MSMIPESTKVVKGDSMSVDQLGVIEELKKRNQNTVIDPFERDAEGRTILQGEERRRAQKACNEASYPRIRRAALRTHRQLYQLQTRLAHLPIHRHHRGLDASAEGQNKCGASW